MEKFDREKIMTTDVSPAEFKFIRQLSGITFNALAKTAGRLSRTTPFNWEQQAKMKQYQVDLLRNLISPIIWKTCREIWHLEIYSKS